MSYFHRFFWTKLHKPSLHIFILILLSLFCFQLCTGSLRDKSTTNSNSNSVPSASSSLPKIPESSGRAQPAENKIPSIESNLLRTADDSLLLGTTKFPNEINNTPTTTPPSPLPPQRSSRQTDEGPGSAAAAEALKEAKVVIRRMTEKSQPAPTTAAAAVEDDPVLALKEQDKQLGINNVDKELDLELTTVENVKELEQNLAAGSTDKLRPEQQIKQNDLYEEEEEDDFDDEGDEGDDDDDDQDEIETIILNSANHNIRQLPFCQSESRIRSGSPGSEEIESAGSSDQLILARKRKGLLFNNRGKQIVVATLDGKITFLDQSGKVHWSVGTGQFFSSTISSLQLSENGKLVKLIPSLTGGLYKYDGQNLQAMPLTADTLLRKSFKLASDVVITGGREVKTFGVDLSSGRVKYECGMDGCRSAAAANTTTPEDEEAEKSKIVLIVKKQMQTVRAIESTTGAERWNFSVATHELAIAGLSEGCHEGATTLPIEEGPAAKGQGHSHSAITKFFRMVIPEGLVFGADEGNQIIWQHKFESPISQAWLFENGRLTIIDPIKCAPLMDHQPSLYVGLHKQQMYVQESQSTAHKVKVAFELTGGGSGGDELGGDETGGASNDNQRRIEWKPLTVAIRDENTALSPIYHGPFFVYEKEQVIYPAIEHNGSAAGSKGGGEAICPTGDPNQAGANEGEGIGGEGTLMDTGILLTLATLLFYWKEVLGISLLTTAILLIPVARIVRNRTVRQVMAYLRVRLEEIAQLRDAQQEQEQAQTGGARSDTALVLYHQRNNSTSTLTSATTTSGQSAADDPAGVGGFGGFGPDRARTTSSSSSHSFGGGGGCGPDEIPFVSQYIKEFIPIQCLGRGGFGVVFEAKKKIDDRNYAVKRIPLPNRTKSRDRVMREVKALAKLDHKHIVRYFNAWIESPPPGWLEKNDPLWNQMIINSPSPTTDFPPSEFGEDEDASVFPNLKKTRKDYHEISLGGFTPDPEQEGRGLGDNNNDDSFIVFANSSSGDGDDEEEQLLPAISEKPPSCSEIIDIPPNQSRSNSNEESEEGPFWKSTKGRGGDSNSNEDLGIDLDQHEHSHSFEHSKFFVRPTTLDIPSSNNTGSFSSTHSNNSDPFGGGGGSDSPPLGIMYLYIQQELCQKRTLQEWLLLEKERRDICQVLKMFIQIVEAVEYIHSHHLIHRDLKPSNIFLAGGGGGGRSGSRSSSMSLGTPADDDNEEPDGGEMLVKIGDFGLATTSTTTGSNLMKLDDDLEQGEAPAGTGGAASNVKLTGLVGTTLYMSYEQSQKKSYNHKVDIYSLGLILFEMIVPFSTSMERYHLLTQVRNLAIPPTFVKSYPEEHKLIKRMVSHKPEDRPEATEIKYWLTQYLQELNSQSSILRNMNSTSSWPSSSAWQRSKSTPTEKKRLGPLGGRQEEKEVAKILKAHSFM